MPDASMKWKYAFTCFTPNVISWRKDHLPLEHTSCNASLTLNALKTERKSLGSARESQRFRNTEKMLTKQCPILLEHYKHTNSQANGSNA